MKSEAPRGEDRDPKPRWPESRRAPSEALLAAAAFALPAVLALGAASALAFALFAVGSLGHWELFIGEQENVYFASRLAHAGSLYHSWGFPGPIFPIYPPGFYVVAVPLTWIGGNAVWTGRIVSILAFAFASVAAGSIAARLGCRRVEIASSALAFITLPAGAQVLYAARPDGLAVGLTAAMLLATTIWEDSRGRRALIVAGAASVALVLTKQNFAPIVVAVLIALWLRDRRIAIRFALWVGAALAAFIALTDLLSGGAFLSNTRDFSSTGYSLSALRSVLKGLLLPFPHPVFVVAGIEAAFRLRSWRRARAVAWAWPASVIVLLSAIKVGSAGNYAVTLGLTSSILLGPALARARTAAGTRTASALAAALALMLAPAAIQSARAVPEAHRHFAARSALNDEAVSLIRRQPGPLLSDRVDLALASAQAPGFDIEVADLLAVHHRWDPAALASAVDHREFGVIQASTDLLHGPTDWPASVVSAVRQRYCPIWSASLEGGGFFVAQNIFTYQEIWLYRRCKPLTRAPGARVSGARPKR